MDDAERRKEEQHGKMHWHGRRAARAIRVREFLIEVLNDQEVECLMSDSWHLPFWERGPLPYSTC
jgi:hypothetical protein